MLVSRYPVLYHMAEDGSWEGIQRLGFLSTSALLDRFEVRDERRFAIESVPPAGDRGVRTPQVGHGPRAGQQADAGESSRALPRGHDAARVVREPQPEGVLLGRPRAAAEAARSESLQGSAAPRSRGGRGGVAAAARGQGLDLPDKLRCHLRDGPGAARSGHLPPRRRPSRRSGPSSSWPWTTRCPTRGIWSSP